MIPYSPQPVWHVGRLAIHGFGLMAAIALLTGYGLALSIARRRGVPERDTAVLFLSICAASLLLGHLWAAGFRPSLAVWRVQSTAGFVTGGLCVVAAAFVLRGAPVLRVLDVLALAFPVAWMLLRFGCFLAHDHIGRASGAWYGVRFPQGPRLDLGLLECAAAFFAAPILWFAAGRVKRSGAILLLLLAMALATRLAILSL